MEALQKFRRLRLPEPLNAQTRYIMRLTRGMASTRSVSIQLPTVIGLVSACSFTIQVLLSQIFFQLLYANCKYNIAFDSIESNINFRISGRHNEESLNFARNLIFY